MEETFRLGRIAGIPIGVNWSVLVVVWLLAWSLAAGYLPAAEPGYRSGEYWLVGVAAAVVFLASLLAHEMAHALVAIRGGVGVEGVTLWLFGGVSKLDREASTPSSELRIALAGPAVSLGVAAAGGLGAAVLHAAGAPGLAVAALVWLATINAVLGIFNLVPAAPLDGGRVLRAVLWQRRGDHLSATLSASRAGQARGFVLIALGLLRALLGATLGGLWMVFLGLFLLSAAKAEASHAVLFDALDGVAAGRIMSSPVVTVASDTSLQRLVDDVVMVHHCSAFPALDPDGRLVGLVTLRQIREVPRSAWPGTTVAQVATPIEQLVLTSPEQPLPELLGRMGTSSDGRALVFDGESLVGIISPTDIMRTSELATMAGPR